MEALQLVCAFLKPLEAGGIVGILAAVVSAANARHQYWAHLALGSTQPLIKISTRNADCQGNVGPLTSHNPTGLHGPLQG
jgi:hypothetical protein